MRNLYIIILLTIVFFNANAQQEEQYTQAQQVLDERGEVYFSFNYPGFSNKYLLNKISVDRVADGKVFAYANRREFEAVFHLLTGPEILTSPSLKYPPRMAGSLKDVQTWNSYPTYGQYTAMMDSFATAHPEICRKEIIGTTDNGRELQILKISDNVDQKEAEPEFLYISSIHGDELIGAVLLLRLTDYLLSNYGTDPEVTELVDNTEIWINPLSNPDGTYFLGNNTVAGAIRFNSNFVDLNRNFPDPQDGPNPDGNIWQAETQAWMQFMTQHNFVMAANYHGGAELMNYPWDTWAQLHADDLWMQLVSREYADTVQSFDTTGYFTDMNDGISNGNAWFEINGGRQDYSTYFRHCREITIEVGDSKKPPATELPSYWDKNFRSLINYMKQVQYGVHGIVTDSITHEPLKAFIEVLQHDFDSSQVYTCDTINGDYHRLIKAGTYDIRYSSPGYITKTITGVAANDYAKTVLDVQLVKIPQSVPETGLSEIRIYPNPTRGILYIEDLPEKDLLFKVYDITGRIISVENKRTDNGAVFDFRNTAKGVYSIEITGSKVSRYKVVHE